MSYDERDESLRKHHDARKLVNEILANYGWTLDGCAPRVNGTVLAYKLRRLVDGHTAEHRVLFADLAMNAVLASEMHAEPIDLGGTKVHPELLLLAAALLVVTRQHDKISPPPASDRCAACLNGGPGPHACLGGYCACPRAGCQIARVPA